MKLPANRFRQSAKQRGVVLFFALIALVVMSLAAVALIRSVDTTTMIAGNLAFKQAATNSGDSGAESAIAALAAMQAAMDAAGNQIMNDTGCPSACTNTLNITDTAKGYYSNSDSVNLTGSAVWDAIDQSLVPEIVDQSGNRIRYVIERICRVANEMPTTTNCLFSSPALDNNGQEVPLPSTVCTGTGCPKAGQAPEYRITSRVVGPDNTLSYVQTYLY